jgi:hypothetical protein
MACRARIVAGYRILDKGRKRSAFAARSRSAPRRKPLPVYPWTVMSSGMMRIATMFAILIIGLIAGPAVSL